MQHFLVKDKKLTSSRSASANKADFALDGRLVRLVLVTFVHICTTMLANYLLQDNYLLNLWLLTLALLIKKLQFI